MFGYLRQSTASQSKMVGPFIDDTDFKTVETGLTVNNTDVKLSKNGAAGVNKNSGGGTHRNNGMYSLTFDATDSNTIGELEGSILVAGALVVVFKFQVLDENSYDAIYASPSTILTSADVGLMYESTISTLNSQVSFDMSDSFATDDVGIGNTVTIVDTGNSTNFHTTWIADLDQTNNRIIVNDAPPWTVQTTDTVRVMAQAHPGYHSNAQISNALLLTKDTALGYFQLLCRKDAAIASDRAVELGELQANEGSGAGTYQNSTDSLESNALTFTSGSAQVDVKRVNGTEVTGVGSASDPWNN